MKTKEMQYRDLAKDYSISRVIKGGWQLSSGHLTGADIDRAKSIDDIITFVQNGITTLDFGDIYVGVEEMIGDALKKIKNTAGEEVCQAVQLHTKYVPDRPTLASHQFSNVEKIVKRSLSRLGVERLDLVQFHWWDYQVPGYIEALQHLATLQRQGFIRLLGVTNFDVIRMHEFIDAGVTPSTLQLQYSILDQRPAKEMTSVCLEHGIQLLCYGTVAGGFLSERYIDMPEPEAPFKNRSLIKYKLIIDECGGWEIFQIILKTLRDIAKKHACDIGTIASAYILQKPQVAAVIVGAKDTNHLPQNIRIANISLDLEDLSTIENVLQFMKKLPGDVYDLERNDAIHAGIMHTSNNRL